MITSRQRTRIRRAQQTRELRQAINFALSIDPAWLREIEDDYARERAHLRRHAPLALVQDQVKPGA